MELGEQIANEQYPLKHSDGSDCIGCSPPPRLRRQGAAVDLVASSEDSSASQSQESLDASDSFLPSIPEDEEEAMVDDPDAIRRFQRMIKEDAKFAEKQKGNRTLINL